MNIYYDTRYLWTTERFSEYEIQASLIKTTQLDFPDFPLYTQGIERAVKLTSEILHIVYRFEAMHRHILRASLISKGSYNENFKDMHIEIFGSLHIITKYLLK